jgi:hypothetical protein
MKLLDIPFFVQRLQVLLEGFIGISRADGQYPGF